MALSPTIAPMVININEPIAFDALKGFHEAGSVRVVIVYDPVKNKHYRVSENTSLDETLVFHCDSEGAPISYREVAGSRGCTIEDLLKEWAQGSLYFYGENDG